MILGWDDSLPIVTISLMNGYEHVNMNLKFRVILVSCK